MEAYVHDPPTGLKAHPKGPCFQLLEPGGLWFKVHWHRPPKNGEVARAYVEQILAEVVTGKCDYGQSTAINLNLLMSRKAISP